MFSVAAQPDLIIAQPPPWTSLGAARCPQAGYRFATHVAAAAVGPVPAATASEPPQFSSGPAKMFSFHHRGLVHVGTRRESPQQVTTAAILLSSDPSPLTTRYRVWSIATTTIRTINCWSSATTRELWTPSCPGLREPQIATVVDVAAIPVHAFCRTD